MEDLSPNFYVKKTKKSESRGQNPIYFIATSKVSTISGTVSFIDS